MKISNLREKILLTVFSMVVFSVLAVAAESAVIARDVLSDDYGYLAPQDFKDTVANLSIDSTVVSAERTYIKKSAGGYIYDVLSDPDSRRMKMDEFMLKLPGMEMNYKDRKLKFSENKTYVLLINGKENMMIKNNRQYIMTLLQADYMKYIEVMDPPPAEYSQYDVAINIILEKELPEGVAGLISASASTNERYSGKGDFTFKYGRFISAVNYDYRYAEPRGTFYRYERDFFSEIGSKTQFYDSQKYSFMTTHNVNVDLSYEISKKTNITASFITKASRSTDFMEIKSHDLTENGTEQNYYEALNKNVAISKPKFNARVKLTHKIKDGSLSLSYNLDNSDERSEYYNSTQSWNKNTSSNNSVAAYFNKTFGKHSINVSASYIHRKYGNDSDEKFSDEAGNSWFSGLSYTQQVSSLNASYRFRSRKLFLTARLNGDYTDNAGTYRQKEITPLSYSGWAIQPMVSAIYMFRKQTISLTLNSSTMRPNISYLNPYLDDSDPMNLRQGNPELKPEIGYSTNLNYKLTLLKNKMSIRFGAGANYIDKAVEVIQSIRDNTSFTTYQNIGSRTNVNTSFYWSYRIHKAISLVLDLKYIWTFADDGKGHLYKNNGYHGTFNLGGNLWKGGRYDFFLSTDVIPPLIQDKKKSFHADYSIVISQSLIKNKLNIGINASNFLKGRYVTYSTTSGENFTTRSSQEHLGSNIHFFVSWVFGKLKDKAMAADRIATDLVRTSD